MIYFAQAGHDGPVKIGHTKEATPKSRMLGLQSGSPEPLRLLAVIEGDRYEEEALHQRFVADCGEAVVLPQITRPEA